MKKTIVASLAVLLLCSGSGAYAQSASNAPQQPAAANSSDASADQGPPIDVNKLAPNQREYLFIATISNGSGDFVVPEQLAKYKEMYEKMPAAQQLQMVTQTAASIPKLPKEMRDKIMNNMPSPK